MEYKVELNKFLADRYVFKMFEIDLWSNGEPIYRYQKKKHQVAFTEPLGVDFLRSDDLYNWEVVTERTINYLFDEFVFYMMMVKRVNTGIKSKKKAYKENILTLIEMSLAQVVEFDSKIESLFQKKSLQVKGIKPLPRVQRTEVELNKWQFGHIHGQDRSPAIVDPCIVYSIDKTFKTRYDVMFVSNLSDTKKRRNSVSVEYGFLSVYPWEIGRTPTEAINNSYAIN
ncbi:hypothetical protein [Draconibacterium sediminis]|uniref:hypothetical protein n=1 Tax=Draconibacterium sediminis TaxID=1544798 RepID=UPI0026ED09DD|nr:hypothetical protein [Draconibacterium sediminis]